MIYLVCVIGMEDGLLFIKMCLEDMDVGGMEIVFFWWEFDGDGIIVELYYKL